MCKKISIGILLLILVLFGIIWIHLGNKTREWAKIENQALIDVSTSLGVEKSWDAITEKVDCEILAYGEPREKVLQQLEVISGYQGFSESRYELIENELHVDIGFRGPVCTRIGFNIHLVFDENDLLIRKGSDIGLADIREMMCP